MTAARQLDPLEGLMDLLADRVADRVLARLSAAQKAPTIYTTAKRGTQIPGKSRRWMLEWVKTMPGARKVSRDWEISVKDYEAWVTSDDARRSSSTAPRLARTGKVTSSADDAELAFRAERALRANGLRPTVK